MPIKKSKNEIRVKSTVNGREVENIFFSKKSYELLLKQGQGLKDFSSKEKAEEYYFLLKEYLMKKLDLFSSNCNFFEMDYTLESIKNIEKWYFDLIDKNEFESIGTQREEFEEILGIYWGECAIRYDSLYHWSVFEHYLVSGRYSFYLEDRFGNKISYKYFNDLYKYPGNKTHKRMYREFKKMIMK